MHGYGVWCLPINQSIHPPKMKFSFAQPPTHSPLVFHKHCLCEWFYLSFFSLFHHFEQSLIWTMLYKPHFIQNWGHTNLGILNSPPTLCQAPMNFQRCCDSSIMAKKQYSGDLKSELVWYTKQFACWMLHYSSHVLNCALIVIISKVTLHYLWWQSEVEELNQWKRRNNLLAQSKVISRTGE